MMASGRFLGATCGPYISHITPGAAVGGPIVQPGGWIEIDIPSRRLDGRYGKEVLQFTLAALQFAAAGQEVHPVEML